MAARVLTALLLVSLGPAVFAQEAIPAEPALVIVLSDESLAALMEIEAEGEAEPAVDLSLPTAVFLGAVAANWTSSVAACPEDVYCHTRTPMLPGVSSAKIAVPVGLAIDGATLWIVHAWIAPRWPKVAEGVLYGLALLRGVSTTDHVVATRTRVRGAPPPP